MRRLAIAHDSGGWTASERWTSNGLKPYFNDFVVHNGHAYGFDGNILVVHRSPGRQAQVERRALRQRPARAAGGSGSVAGAVGRRRARARQAQRPISSRRSRGFPALEGKTWNHPVLVRDVLLVRNDHEMAAFRLGVRPVNRVWDVSRSFHVRHPSLRRVRRRVSLGLASLPTRRRRPSSTRARHIDPPFRSRSQTRGRSSSRRAPLWFVVMRATLRGERSARHRARHHCASSREIGRNPRAGINWMERAQRRIVYRCALRRALKSAAAPAVPLTRVSGPIGRGGPIRRASICKKFLTHVLPPSIERSPVHENRSG